VAESVLPSSPAVPGEGAPRSRTPGFLRPLHRRDFRLLVIGQTTSTAGDFLFIVAFPFLLLRSGAGVGGLGLALTLLGVTRVAGTLLGGLAADRWPPRAVMIGTDAARVAVLAALAYELAAGTPRLWQFAVAATVIGVLEGLFLPAYRVITPALLPEGELAAGNSAGESLNTVAAILGQLVAGVALSALGAAAVVGIDAATFVVSTATLLAMSASSNPSGSVEKADATHTADAPDTPNAAEPTTARFRDYALRSRLYLTITVMTGMVSITAAGLFAVGLPVLADRRFASAAEAYGILLVGVAAGRLAGSVAAGRFAAGRRRGRVTLALLVVHGTVLTCLPALHHLGLLLPALVVLGFADGTLLVLVVTVMQQMVPRDLLGRAMAGMAFVQTGSFPISVALAGFAVGRWGLTTAFTAGGIGVLAIAALGAGQRVVRDA
jgi:predicted MFS family arabinose efflux permease